MIEFDSEVGLEDVRIGTGIECWTEPIDRYYLRPNRQCVVGVRAVDGVFDDDASVSVLGQLGVGYLQL